MIINQKMKFTLNINSTGTLYQHYWKEVNVLILQKFFNENLNKLKNTCKVIKNLISLKTVSHSSPSSISDNNKTVTRPFEIANAFNNYFSRLALNIQSSIKYSEKEFHEFIPPLNINIFSLHLLIKMK